LMQLRNLEKNTLKNMALTGKIFKEKKDILYIRGEINGEIRGERKKALEMGLKMKMNGEPLSKIMEYTELSIQEIETL